MNKNKKISVKSGFPPGTLVHIGNNLNIKSKISVLTCNIDKCNYTELKDISELPSIIKNQGFHWINVIGLNDVKLVEKIGNIFNLHSLTLEDIVNTLHRPKYDDYLNYGFIILKKLWLPTAENKVKSEQISIVFKENVIITFLEINDPIFDDFINRNKNSNTLYNKGIDYIVYSLIDIVVDSYYEIVEFVEDNIELVEEKIINTPQKENLNTILNLKRQLTTILKVLFPLRETIFKLQRKEFKFLEENSKAYYNDVYDHIIHLMESVENQRDILSGLMDIYLTNISYKMNSVMKVLTIISTIFIPITFLAGVYGMNFKYFPEIEAKYGYLYFWIVVLLSTFGMLIYFKKRKWF